jgi:predicted secreted protein
LFTPFFSRKSRRLEGIIMTFSSIIIALLANSAASPPVQAAPAPAAAGSPAPRPPEKQVCKTTQVTGSLARTRRVCQSSDTWAKQSESHQEQWKALQGTHGHTNEELVLKEWSPILPR